MTNISDRIAGLIASLGISTRAFEQQIGCSNGVIARCINKKTDISSIWVSKIIEIYTTVSPRWLLTGEGDIFIKQADVQSPHNTDPSSDNSFLYNMYKEKDVRIESLLVENATLKERLRVQEEKILGLQQDARPDLASNTGKVSAGSTRPHKGGVADSESAQFAEQP